MTNVFERAANAAIAIAALALVWIFVRRELHSNERRNDGAAPSVVTFYQDWMVLDSASVPLDSIEGNIRVYVFSDLECPFCAAFHSQIIPELYRQYSNSVSVRFVHFPLKSHTFSRQAAVALECAGEQGREKQFLDVTYSKQDSIGLIPWTRFASTAGVPDSTKCGACIQAVPNPRIERGVTLGSRFDVISTPTIIVNGWRFTGLPESSSFMAAMDSIKAGGIPVISASGR